MGATVSTLAVKNWQMISVSVAPNRNVGMTMNLIYRGG